MIELIITSPKKTDKFDNLTGVSLPSISGQMQVLSGHAEAFLILEKGKVILKKEKSKKVIEIEKAGCHIKKDKVNIIL